MISLKLVLVVLRSLFCVEMFFNSYIRLINFFYCAIKDLEHLTFQLNECIEVLLKKEINPFPQFQINLQRKMRFTGIVTQGASRIGTAEFIKAFKVASSLDGKTFTMYRTDGQRKDNVRRRVKTLQCTTAHNSYFKLFFVSCDTLKHIPYFLKIAMNH